MHRPPVIHTYFKYHINKNKLINNTKPENVCGIDITLIHNTSGSQPVKSCCCSCGRNGVGVPENPDLEWAGCESRVTMVIEARFGSAGEATDKRLSDRLYPLRWRV
ncbi:hypothetical protein Zmor_015913 [Zophobas morio]|uniref:Uncharacterized protein n=1 Tax=Zophobas morio TaxID=2755281 RepID=A0AA38IKQ9_9CUCU|nr:hypothetical protein Zmor_015913 [Zophobas morio]